MPGQFPEDPNHPLNIQRNQRPNYIPGQPYGASQGYSGYGGLNNAAPAQFNEADYARNPSLGASPATQQMTGSAFGAGQQAFNRNMAAIKTPDRMADRLAKVRAPMTPEESQQIVAQYGGRAYMKNAQPQPQMAMGLRSTPVAAQGPPPPPQPVERPASAQATPAMIGAQPPAGLVGPPRPVTINRPVATPGFYDRAVAAQGAGRMGGGATAYARPSPMQAPDPQTSMFQPQLDRMNSQLVTSGLLARYMPEIGQEDQLRNRMLAAQATAMEEKANRHPVVDAILGRAQTPGGYNTFDDMISDYNRATAFAGAKTPPAPPPMLAANPGGQGLASVRPVLPGIDPTIPMDPGSIQGRMDAAGVQTPAIKSADSVAKAREAAAAAGIKPGTQQQADAAALFKQAHPDITAQHPPNDVFANPSIDKNKFGMLGDMADQAVRLFSLFNPFMMASGAGAITPFATPHKARAEQSLDASFMGVPHPAPPPLKFNPEEASRGMPYGMITQGPQTAIRRFSTEGPRIRGFSPQPIERLY